MGSRAAVGTAFYAVVVYDVAPPLRTRLIRVAEEGSRTSALVHSLQVVRCISLLEVPSKLYALNFRTKGGKAFLLRRAGSKLVVIGFIADFPARHLHGARQTGTITLSLHQLCNERKAAGGIQISPGNCVVLELQRGHKL